MLGRDFPTQDTLSFDGVVTVSAQVKKHPVKNIRLAVATSVLVPAIHPDDEHLAASLRVLGIQPTACVWNDPAVDWSQFDAVLVRTIWDYFKHYTDFLAWLDQLEQLGIPTINPGPMIRWNSDKRYLIELEQHGAAIIPTRLTHTRDLAAVLAITPDLEVVVKPTVSGTAWRTLRGIAGEDTFAQAVGLLPEGDYLLQPFVPQILMDGEWSLLFFGGQFSHAVIKRAVAGDYRVQSEFGGTAELAEPTAAVLAGAHAALAAAAAVGQRDPVYARVDGVLREGRFLLMELEMIEPLLHLAERPDAAERFARQLAARLDRIVTGTDAAFAAEPDAGDRE